MDVMRGAPAAEKRIEAKRRVSSQRKRKRNSDGDGDEAPSKTAHWERARANPKRRAQKAALEGVQGWQQEKQRRWHLAEPAGFDASWQRYLPLHPPLLNAFH